MEIREAICAVVERRSAHFASNLGVVELTLALHTTFDFTYDRLVWDVGHQCYPHKLITGRYNAFSGIRTQGGLMGYPNPAESEYDLFMTGHAGCSISTAVGLKCGDDLLYALQEEKFQKNKENSQKVKEAGVSPEDDDSVNTAAVSVRQDKRHAVAVIGDGSFANGVVFEGLNHLGGIQKNVTIVLNDNKMSICPRVGGMGKYLDSLRMHPIYSELKEGMKAGLYSIPVVGKPLKNVLHYVKDAVKAGILGGMFFDELGIHYLGPVNGHDIQEIQKFLMLARQCEEPVLLHVLTRKGSGYLPAEEDPTKYHAPPPLKHPKRIPMGVKQTPLEISAKIEEDPSSDENYSGETRSEKTGSQAELREKLCRERLSIKVLEDSYTQVASRTVLELMRKHPEVVVITAAMCQGNKLELVRDEFPERFYDVGICESHAVTLAAGMAKAGIRPIVDIYSTFMQRAYDHLFQEVSLQNLPVILLMDRAGLVGPDGPTHHGTYDLAYMRPFPNIITAVPADAYDLREMLFLAVEKTRAPFSIRYPKTWAVEICPEEHFQQRIPVMVGGAEIFLKGRKGAGLLLAAGTQIMECLRAVTFLSENSEISLNLNEAFWHNEKSYGVSEGGRSVSEITVVNARFVKPLDTNTILPLVEEAAWMVTVEEGVRDGGFGSAVLEAITDAGIRVPPVRRLGIQGFIQHATREQQLAEAGLDMENIIQTIREMRNLYPASGFGEISENGRGE